jgi:hypothetical protein
MKQNMEELTDSLMGGQNNLGIVFCCPGRLIPNYRRTGRSGKRKREDDRE